MFQISLRARAGTTTPRKSRRVSLVVASTVVIVAAGLLIAPHAWGQWHFRAAQHDLAAYRLPEAREHIRKCLRVWPRSSQLHLVAGRAARQAYDYAAADDHLRECQRLRGGQTDDIVLERMLIRAQLGEVDAVVPFLRAQVEADHPESVLILEAMAWGCLQQLRVSEAAFYLGLLRQREPDNVRALMYEGWAREMLNVTDDAIEDYRHALDLQPDNYEARLRLANCLLEANRAPEALEHFLKLHNRTPDSELIRTHLGRCYHGVGRLDEGCQILDALLAEKPAYAPALTARARLAVQLHDYAAAEAWLRETIRIDPTSYPSHYLLFECLQQQGKEKEAQIVKERMDRMKTDLARVREIITTELARTPQDPELYFEAGVISVRLGDNREAAKWFGGALRQNPQHVKSHAALMRLFQFLGDSDKAAHHRQFVPPDTPVVDLPFLAAPADAGSRESKPRPMRDR